MDPDRFTFIPNQLYVYIYENNYLIVSYFRMKKKAAQFPEGYRDRAAERRANGEGPEDEEATMSVGLHNMPPPSEEYVV